MMLFKVDIDALYTVFELAIGKTIASADKVQDTIVLVFTDGTRIMLGPSPRT